MKYSSLAYFIAEIFLTDYCKIFLIIEKLKFVPIFDDIFGWTFLSIFELKIFKECSVFVFEKKIAEKLHKPRRKETVTELLKASVRNLERFRHPKVIEINIIFNQKHFTIFCMTSISELFHWNSKVTRYSSVRFIRCEMN